MNTNRLRPWMITTIVFLSSLNCTGGQLHAADDPFVEGRAALAREDWTAAAEAFREFLRRHPDSDQAPEARFWAGYSLVREGDGENAIKLLRPFEALLAENKWADDALLNLGTAYEYTDELDLAIAAWKRLLKKYTQSVWRAESMRNLIYVLFYRTRNYEACQRWCAKFLSEFREDDAAEELSMLGARCLITLRRFDEAEQWIKQWMNGGATREEVLRRILEIQKNLVRGQAESAFKRIAALENDFPDVNRDAWIEWMIELANILRDHGQKPRARELLKSLLLKMNDRDSEAATWVLNAFAETFSVEDDEEDDESTRQVVDALEQLVTEMQSAAVRVEIRLLQSEWLDGGESPNGAVELLRRALKEPLPAFARCRLILRLSEQLADNDQVAAARAAVQKELASVERGDLVKQLQSRLDELESPAP